MDTGKFLLNLSPCPPSALSLIHVTLCGMNSPYLFYSPKAGPRPLPEACLPYTTPTRSPPSPGKPPHLCSHFIQPSFARKEQRMQG